jgi:hypothetical protein
MGTKLLAKIIDIEKNKQVWIWGKACCRTCGHEHMIVCHKDATKDTECSECGSMTDDLIKEHAY